MSTPPEVHSITELPTKFSGELLEVNKLDHIVPVKMFSGFPISVLVFDIHIITILKALILKFTESFRKLT
jgi:hypothetical protein